MECIFYSKVGICRHGEKCSKIHKKPEASKFVTIQCMYPGQDLEAFVTDLFTETAKIAPIREFLIAGNAMPHLRGTVYLRFYSEKDAIKVVENFNQRWYAQHPIYCELSPVTELSTTCCRDPNQCLRKSSCNYVHPIELPKPLLESLFQSQIATYR